MKHVVIVAHPKPDSFNLTMAHAYQKAAEAAGETVVLRDLYRMGFDPRLTADELPSSAGFAAGADIKAERALIGDAGVFVFVYPLMFDSPPAMLKGYLERVFGMGFGFGPGEHGNEPLLRGRSMVSISSSGGPRTWLEQTGDWDALRKLFDEHFAGACGLSVLDHLHFGGIAPGITRESVDHCREQVKAMVKAHFGRAGQSAA
jgi:NAD(P)H dehydrogenase (quinone)